MRSNRFRGVQRIDPIFSRWFTGRRRWAIEPLDLQHEALARKIALGVTDDYDGSPLPRHGYIWGAYNAPSPTWSHEVFRLGGYAGSDVQYVANVANLGGVHAQKFAHSFIDFDVLRKVLLALVEPFEPTIAYAFSATLGDLWPKGRDCPSLPPCWMSYLAPPVARRVIPPDTATYETPTGRQSPDGGDKGQVRHRQPNAYGGRPRHGGRRRSLQ